MELAEFDVTQQLPQDLMHVILEGIFPMHIQQLLEYIVDVSAHMTLAQINSRIAAYPYAYFNDKPSPITGFNVQGTQSGICGIMTDIAFIHPTQMWELMNIFPFIVDMSLDDAHHACFMLLNDISGILFSPVIAKDQIPFLAILIKQYLEQFTILYPHRPLTPKFHYLVHIPALIARYHS